MKFKYNPEYHQEDYVNNDETYVTHYDSDCEDEMGNHYTPEASAYEKNNQYGDIVRTLNPVDEANLVEDLVVMSPQQHHLSAEEIEAGQKKYQLSHPNAHFIAYSGDDRRTYRVIDRVMEEKQAENSILQYKSFKRYRLWEDAQTFPVVAEKKQAREVAQEPAPTRKRKYPG